MSKIFSSNIKKICICIAVLILFSLPGGLSAYASAEPQSYFGFDGLIEAVCETELGSYDEVVTPEAANAILKKAFGCSPFKGNTVLRRDLIKYLAEKITSDDTTVRITGADYGLVAKDFRRAYVTLCNSGRLYIENGFLNSDSELTYGYFINELAFFKDIILKNNSVTSVSGTVTGVSKMGDVWSVDMYGKASGVFTVKTENLDKKKVFKNGECKLYDRNIARDDNLTVYRNSENKVLFLSVDGEFFTEWLNLKSQYDLIRADIYYVDENSVIVKNPFYFNGTEYMKGTELYLELPCSSSAVFVSGGKNVNADFININLLDKNAYIICDKSKNTKYIYITE